MPSSPSFPCSGLTIEGIMSSKQISDGRKETLSYGFKHVVREGMIAKAKLLHPDNFAWSDESYGTAEGVITTGIGASIRVDWLLHMKPPILSDYNFAILKDVAYTNSATVKGGMCLVCRRSNKELLRRCTATADI